MKVAILHEDFAARPDAPVVDTDVLNTVAAVEAALERRGHGTLRVGVTADVSAWLARLATARVDVVFNLVESLAGESGHEIRVAGLLELMGLRVTGAPSEVLAVARRKDRVHALLTAACLPTPCSAELNESAAASWSRFPAIVKPAAEDGSIGISQGSVVRDSAALRQALAARNGDGRLLVQQFLSGIELAVAFVGSCTLPISEIDFSPMPPDHWPMVSYEAKWQTGSIDYHGTPVYCPARIDATLHKQAVDVATATWRLLEGSGYGRVDLRADESGGLHVLDVNPNPDLGPDAGLARMAAAAHWSYDDLVERILMEAINA